MNYQSQIESYFADKEALLLEGISRLVSIRSVKGEPAPAAPFGPGPAAALSEALKLAGEWGLKDPTSHEGYVGTADLDRYRTLFPQGSGRLHLRPGHRRRQGPSGGLHAGHEMCEGPGDSPEEERPAHHGHR